MTIPLEPSQLDARIVELVKQCWEERNKPLLLSQLGGADSGEIARSAKLTAASLGEYLHRRLDSKVRVIRHSRNPTIIGAVPADVEADTDDLLASTYGHSERLKEGASPRFHPAFWAAFRKRLDGSRKRYISVKKPLEFRDMSSEDLEERQAGFVEGSVEIERKYIADTEAEPAEVHQKACDWLEKNNLDQVPFLMKNESAISHPFHNDLLGRLLLVLGDDELRRISMPLDIVRKLRNQSL